MAKLNFKKITDRVVQKAPGLVIGSVASNYLANAINKMLDKDKTNTNADGSMIKPTLGVAGSLVVIGAVLPSVAGGGRKGEFIDSIADGIMATGAVQLGKALKLPGIGDAGDGWDAISGSAAEDYMSGTDTSNSISGNAD
jgi:hypothetical protein